jgi:FtsZ-interacting cell division protein ZipA
MQQLPTLLMLIAVIGGLALATLLIGRWRKKVRRRTYLRDRDARVRQQWADLEAMGDTNGRR